MCGVQLLLVEPRRNACAAAKPNLNHSSTEENVVKVKLVAKLESNLMEDGTVWCL